ncbi:MAG: hypothetical protein A2045_14670 [Rhodocyclales bacterium GWA2_65_20]|nr:MAG: hypothetical protein A2045_14670 [Rhodocyclales bacterium GWA2_65_20]
MKTQSEPPSAKLAMPHAAIKAGYALDSAVLLGAKGEVEIAHQGEIYRLRRTRQGKLILTK